MAFLSFVQSGVKKKPVAGRKISNGGSRRRSNTTHAPIHPSGRGSRRVDKTGTDGDAPHLTRPVFQMARRPLTRRRHPSPSSRRSPPNPNKEKQTKSETERGSSTCASQALSPAPPPHSRPKPNRAARGASFAENPLGEPSHAGQPTPRATLYKTAPNAATLRKTPRFLYSSVFALRCCARVLARPRRVRVHPATTRRRGRRENKPKKERKENKSSLRAS